MVYTSLVHGEGFGWLCLRFDGEMAFMSMERLEWIISGTSITYSIVLLLVASMSE